MTSSTQPPLPIQPDDAATAIGKLRAELDDLYRREPPKDAPKVRPGRLRDVGVSVISRLQQIDHLQRYQIACLESELARALNPPKHRFWGAGEPDCPREIKAGNGELHTLRCKVCGEDDPRDERCFFTQGIEASGRDGETRLDAKHESPIGATSADAPTAGAIQPDLIEQDLALARLGDYPGAAGCKRIAEAHATLQDQLERVREALRQIKALTIGYSDPAAIAIHQIADEALTGLSEEGDRG